MREKLQGMGNILLLILVKLKKLLLGAKNGEFC